MKAWRAQLSCLMPLVALLFATGVGVPRPGLFFHVHAGGDHIHVHDEDAGSGALDDQDHDHEGAQHHHHHDHLGPSADAPAEWESPEPTDLGHWHSQHPFHRVVPATQITLARVAFDVAVDAQAIPPLIEPALLRGHARAPPCSV